MGEVGLTHEVMLETVLRSAPLRRAGITPLSSHLFPGPTQLNHKRMLLLSNPRTTRFPFPASFWFLRWVLYLHRQELNAARLTGFNSPPRTTFRDAGWGQRRLTVVRRGNCTVIGQWIVTQGQTLLCVLVCRQRTPFRPPARPWRAYIPRPFPGVSGSEQGEEGLSWVPHASPRPALPPAGLTPSGTPVFSSVQRLLLCSLHTSLRVSHPKGRNPANHLPLELPHPKLSPRGFPHQPRPSLELRDTRKACPSRSLELGCPAQCPLATA